MNRWVGSMVGLTALLAAPHVYAGPPHLDELWTLGGFDAPESVVLDAKRNELLVTNVHGEGDAQDGNGYISRVSLDGKLLQQRWIEGLDGPKGTAIRGRRLFVADIDELVEIDLDDGAVVARHAVEGAKFLNDVVDAGEIGVLISDSALARIYRWHQGTVEVWLEHEALGAVNGLLREADRLVVSTMRGKLLAVDLRTRSIQELARDLGDGDGIVALGGQTYLVSEWPGRLFHVLPNGEHFVVIDSRAEKRFINDMLAIDLPGDSAGDHARLLLIPSWEPGSLTAYRLKH